MRTLATEVLGRGRMGGVESVVLAQSCERVGILAVSTTLSVSQYRPCFFPPPALMMASLEKGVVAGSHVSPWSAFPISVYRVVTPRLADSPLGDGGRSVTALFQPLRDRVVSRRHVPTVGLVPGHPQTMH